MDSQVVEAVTLAGSMGDSDFSIFALFVRADWVVKFVVLILLFGSIWCWAIIFQKYFGLKRLNSRSTDFEKIFWSGSALDDLYDRISTQPQDPMSSVFVAATKPNMSLLDNALTALTTVSYTHLTLPTSDLV